MIPGHSACKADALPLSYTPVWFREEGKGKEGEKEKKRRREERSLFPFFSLSFFFPFPLSPSTPLFCLFGSTPFSKKNGQPRKEYRDIFEFPELYKRLVLVVEREKKGEGKKQNEESSSRHFLSSHVEIDESLRRPPAPLSVRLRFFFSTVTRSSDVHAHQAAAGHAERRGNVVDAGNHRKRKRSRRGSCRCRRRRSVVVAFLLRSLRLDLRRRRRPAAHGPALRRRHRRRQAVVPGRGARGRARGRQAAGAAGADADRGLRLPRGPRGRERLG